MGGGGWKVATKSSLESPLQILLTAVGQISCVQSCIDLFWISLGRIEATLLEGYRSNENSSFQTIPFNFSLLSRVFTTRHIPLHEFQIQIFLYQSVRYGRLGVAKQQPGQRWREGGGDKLVCQSGFQIMIQARKAQRTKMLKALQYAWPPEQILTEGGLTGCLHWLQVKFINFFRRSRVEGRH